MKKPENCGSSHCSCIECVCDAQTQATPEESSVVGERAAPLVPMTEDEIVAIASCVGSTYAHRSDPTYRSYGFVKQTLVDFVRKIEAHHSRKQEPTDWSAA